MTTNCLAGAAGVGVQRMPWVGVLVSLPTLFSFALLIKAGMTPSAAVRAATINAALLLGRKDRIGSLEPGKDADIIAVAMSPLDDVTVLERVRFVMRHGVVHVADGARQPFPPR